MPPFNSTGGDLVDQIREWLERQRDRLTTRRNGARGTAPGSRPPRRAGLRSQAVPMGSVRAGAAGRPGRHLRTRADRASRGTYTLILGSVLVVGVLVLVFGLSWALGASGSPPPGTPTPAPVASPLPAPAAQSSPPPFLVPSPSPSPSPSLPPPQQRIHTVEGGDTLNRIAQRYGVTVEAIMQANNFTDRNRILRIGEKLIIPDAPPGSPIPR